MRQIPGSRWFHHLGDATSMFNKINKSGTCASLLLGKYVDWDYAGELQSGHKDKEYKRENFKRILRAKSPLHRQAYNRLRERRNGLPGCHTFTLKTQSRVAIGLGEDSVLENSISLHPLFGFPVLPGAAVKGVTRNFLAENAVAAPDVICRFFGSAPRTSPEEEDRRSGNIVFFDAWPATYSENAGLGQYLEMEVMTPHFQAYYQGKDWPSDKQAPNPISFLVIKTGIDFEFAIAPTGKARSKRATDCCIPLCTVEGWIRQALLEYGAGAKTGSGYGYFS